MAGRRTGALGKRSRKKSLDRDRLVEEYLPLVRHVVGRIALRLPDHVDTEELFQVGSMGLLHASRGFDPSRGVSFKTYAFSLIRGAILDELRRLDLLPRSTREKVRELEACAARLSQELGRPPDASEIAESLGVEERAVDSLRRIARSSSVLSLDDSSGLPETLLMRDVLECPRAVDPMDAAARSEAIEKVALRIRELSEAERRVITFYYREGLLLREIGEILGVTESRVSQIHSRALSRLQEKLNAGDPP